MRLLDTYALYCGAKIDKPYIYESYFPLPFTKYITFQAETPYDSRNYAYWQDVIDMVAPTLMQAGYQILQLGLGKETPYQRVINLLGQTNLHQLAYLIRRSSLHFGPDSFGVHLSSHFDIPIVTMYSISMPEVAGPHFGDKNKHVLFKAYERIGNGKPSYSPQENPKSINTIKPEEIANSILKLLEINTTIPFETIFTGSKYSNKIARELVPNSHHVMPMPEQPIEIRCDLTAFNEQLLLHHLNYWKKAVIVTDKPINIDLLKAYKQNIALVSYIVTDEDSSEFAQSLVQAGLPIVLVSDLHQDSIQKKKIKYYEFGVINALPVPDEKQIQSFRDMDISKLYYRSCKLIASNGKVFGSHADMEADKSLATDFEYHRVIDSPKFWKDLDFYTIVKLS